MTVTDSMQAAILKPAQDLVYIESFRRNAVDEELRMNAFNSAEFKQAMLENPQICRAKEEWKLQDTYQQRATEVIQTVSPLKEREVMYLTSHPELKYVKDRADTYLYLIPKENMVQGETVTFNSQEEVLKAYEPDIVTAVRTPEFYGAKNVNGYVIETRQALVPDGEGYFMAPGKPIAENIQAQAFLTEKEQRRVNEFQHKFQVSIADVDGKQVYQGDEARNAIAWAMQTDREVYEQQQSGYKDVALAEPQRLTVQYGDTVLFDRIIDNGKLELGNYRSVSDAVTALSIAGNQKKHILQEVRAGLRSSEKYTDEPDIVDLLKEYTPKSEYEIGKSLDREFLPEHMADYQPKVGQTAVKDMQWYETKAIVNYCHTAQEKADYIVAELARKYKVDTIKRRIDEYLPTYKTLVDTSLRTHKVRRILQEQESARKQGQHSMKIAEKRGLAR